MAEHLITSGGQTYRVSADGHDGADIDGIIEWLCQFHGEPTTLNALSRPQVISRIGRSSIPSDFPEPGVVIGDEAGKAAAEPGAGCRRPFSSGKKARTHSERRPPSRSGPLRSRRLAGRNPPASMPTRPPKEAVVAPTLMSKPGSGSSASANGRTPPPVATAWWSS